jgi:hypothetical protein
MPDESYDQWMEFLGGPYDGTMVSIAISNEMQDHRVEVYAPFEQWKVLPSGRRWPLIEGHYLPVGMADEELRIVRMEWRQGKPDRTAPYHEEWVRPPPDQ